MAEWSGGDALKRILASLSGKLRNAKEVAVGYPEGSKYPDGTPFAVMAAANNYGNPSNGTPPRPFFSNAVQAGKKTWGPLLADQLKAQGYDAAKALETTGTQMAFNIAESLVATNGPPLSPVTLLLRERFPTRTGMTFADVLQARRDVASGKASGLTGTGAKPLVWTGQLLQHLYGPSAVEVRS